jgi:hypothetical protein
MEILVKTQKSGGDIVDDSTDADLPTYNAVRTFDGGQGVTFSATAQIRSTPTGVFRLRCQVSGTIKLWDAIGATGNVLVDTVALVAGNTLEIGQITTIGVYATVTSGTWTLVDTGV